MPTRPELIDTGEITNREQDRFGYGLTAVILGLLYPLALALSQDCSTSSPTSAPRSRG